MADLRTGEPKPTRERLRELLDAIEGEGDDLTAARSLVERNGADRQREQFETAGGARALTEWLTSGFTQTGTGHA
jgi:hypothetical protein